MAVNKCDLSEDERLSIEVGFYPCLYDKRDKGYKERDRRANAWRKVEEILGYEEGKSLFIYFYLICSELKSNLSPFLFVVTHAYTFF